MTISTRSVPNFMAKKFGGKGVKFGDVVKSKGNKDGMKEDVEEMQTKFKTMKKGKKC